MKPLTAAQHAVLMYAHGDTLEGSIANGAMYAPHKYASAPTLRALAAAGLITLEQRQHVVHTTPQWGQQRARRTEYSLAGAVTPAGAAYAHEHGGVLKGQCLAPGCEDAIRVPQALCPYHAHNGVDAR